MNHLVLLGDSILDNGAYTAGGPAVMAHLQAQLPTNWKVSLLAIDGSVTADVISQLARIPSDTTHLVISAGGNNAILQSGFVSEPAQSVADVLQRMVTIAQQFAYEYQAMLSTVVKRGLPTTVCTVYDPNFADPTVQQLMRAGLVMFNDVILRAAIQAGVAVIDLRVVCISPEDYANEIEPSVAGGAKIAQAIIRAVTCHDFTQPQTTIYS
jgi:GDSL-like Lipase/Acylhydrolase family